MAGCRTCEDPNRVAIEAIGVEALEGQRSWRSAAAEAGLPHHTPLKNHMEKHYVSPMEEAVQEAQDEHAALVAQSIIELQEQMRTAPPEVKPLYAVAIQNLATLQRTNPSQQHLIAALKAIHEVTGMRLEQRMLLDFAKAAFAVPNEATPALPPLVVDAEEVE